MIIQSLYLVILKYLFILLLMVHLLFSFILVRQTQMMMRVVEAKISPIIFGISVMHAFFSFFVLIWAALFL
jgi:hypothetical protein